MDNDIWQDIGLTDNNNEDLDIPAWLGDEHVQKVIKSLLELYTSLMRDAKSC